MNEKLQKIDDALVSVVMTAYNAGKYIAESIESVLNQTYSNFEFIIIEDGSTDNTFEIIQDFAKRDNRIRVIRHDSNKGLSYSRAEYLVEAKGKYVTVVDADDVIFPEKIAKQVSFLDLNPSVYLVGTDAYKINTKGEVLGEIHLGSGAEFVTHNIEKRSSPIHPSIMFRNTGKVKYREKAGLFACEDYDMYLNVILAGEKIDNIPEILMKYRISPTQESSTKFIKQDLFAQEMLKLYLKKKETGIDGYEMLDVHMYDEFANSKESVKKSTRHSLMTAYQCRDYSLFRSKYWEYVRKYGLINRLFLYYIKSLYFSLYSLFNKK
jgi:glycosyltransferase involved in cell wall biosynthesis